MKLAKWLILFIMLVFSFNYLFHANAPAALSASVSGGSEYVTAEDFGASGTDYVDDSAALQAAVDFAAAQGISTVKLLQREYLLKKPLLVKQGVELELGQQTKLLIDGNFRAIELQKNASIINGTIMVVNSTFAAPVIYLDGKQQFSSWDRTRVHNVTIVNASNSYQGTALSLFSGGANHFITYVNFTNLNIIGFQTGIQLRAVKPASGYSWVNANRFQNITIDSCIRGIELQGSQTVPNETSGNSFSSVQVQVEANTLSVLRVSGQDNRFDLMIWDVSKTGTRKLVDLTANSIGTRLDFNLSLTYLNNSSTNSIVQTPYK